MYRRNTRHLQENLFDYTTLMPSSMQEQLEATEEHLIYSLIYCKINEDDFRCLFSATDGRPNSGINALVTAIILKHRYGWSVAQMLHNITFNLATKVALGLRRIDEVPFSRQTYFNFQTALEAHASATGINLLTQVFDSLTSDQLKHLQLKTDIQRTDSFQALSNIRTYNRVGLLIEVLIRLHRVLSEEDKHRLEDVFAPFVKDTAGHFLHHLAESAIDSTIVALGAAYRTIYEALVGTYGEVKEFENFARTYRDHFEIVDARVRIRTNGEMESDTLQSPDDPDATYRKKNGQQYHGQVVNIVETANPDNPLQLITDVAVAPNNRDDSTVFHERIDEIMEKTPELKKMFEDGAYPSEDNDRKLEAYGVMTIQTAIRGCAASGVPIEIVQDEDGTYTVSCPSQCVTAIPTEKKWKAEFDPAVCAGCEHAEKCQLFKYVRGRVYYFTHKDYLKKRRMKNMENIDPAHRSLRANVEATVAEFKQKTRNGKLSVRGSFKTMVFAASMAISINFGRIYRYYEANPV
jgi:hypothetical protein